MFIIVNWKDHKLQRGQKFINGGLRIATGGTTVWEEARTVSHWRKMGRIFMEGEWEVLAGLNELFINSMNWREHLLHICNRLIKYISYVTREGIFSLVQFFSIFQQLSYCSAKFYFRVFSKDSARAVTMSSGLHHP